MYKHVMTLVSIITLNALFQHRYILQLAFSNSKPYQIYQVSFEPQTMEHKSLGHPTV